MYDWFAKTFRETGNAAFWLTITAALILGVWLLSFTYLQQNWAPMVVVVIAGSLAAHLFSCFGVRVTHGDLPIVWTCYGISVLGVNVVFTLIYVTTTEFSIALLSTGLLTVVSFLAYAIALAMPWSASIARLPTQLKQHS